MGAQIILEFKPEDLGVYVCHTLGTSETPLQPAVAMGAQIGQVPQGELDRLADVLPVCLVQVRIWTVSHRLWRLNAWAKGDYLHSSTVC